MKNYEARVLREGLTFGEGPRWHDGRLWYSDFYRHAIFSTDEEGADERLEVSVPNQPSGLGWLPDGDLLYVSMTDQVVMRRHDGTSSLFCDISPYCGFWANEMIVSASGFAYVGNFGFDLDIMLREIGPAGMMAAPPPTTNLVVLDPTGGVTQVIPDMAFPNGTVITPDGATLIVGETMASFASAPLTSPPTGRCPIGASGRSWTSSRPTACALTATVRSGSPTRSPVSACASKRAARSRVSSRRATTRSPACSAERIARVSS